jgi:RNAse (barnase) inhibitor barstar
MKIYSADTWTVEELRDQVADAGRRSLVIPAADSKKAVLATFGEALDFPEHYGVNLDALNDSLHDFADAISDDGQEPLTLIWQVPAAFRTDRSFGVICEILQDAESYAGQDLSVIAVFQLAARLE